MSKPNFLTHFSILVYHQIGRGNNLDYLILDKSLFTEQMHFITKHYRPFSLEDLLQTIRRTGAIPPKSIVVTFDDGYANTYSEAFPILQKYKIPATLFITTGFIENSVRSPYAAKMMSWKMVKEMHKSGIEIGSHTLTHPNLRNCGAKKAAYEMTESKKQIEQKIQAPVKTLAYPYGSSRAFSETTQSLAKKAGYLGACTTVSGQNERTTNPFALRRISLAKSQIRFFALQVSELTKGNLPPEEMAALGGINQKVIRLWKNRYDWLGKRLKRDDFLNAQKEARGSGKA